MYIYMVYIYIYIYIYIYMYCTYVGLHIFHLLVLHAYAPLEFPIRPRTLHGVSALLQKETGSQQRYGLHTVPCEKASLCAQQPNPQISRASDQLKATGARISRVSCTRSVLRRYTTPSDGPYLTALSVSPRQWPRPYSVTERAARRRQVVAPHWSLHFPKF